MTRPAEQRREDVRQAARAQWRANQVTKSPAEHAQTEQRKQELYSKNYRPITERMAGGLEPVEHIDGCSKAARMFFERSRANLEWDCFNCQVFRGYNPDRSAIACLYEHMKRKRDIT